MTAEELKELDAWIATHQAEIEWSPPTPLNSQSAFSRNNYFKRHEMTNSDYAKWRRNGNFTISQNRLLQVSNHISEHGMYTKSEAAQVATYWSLVASGLQNELSLIKSRNLIAKVERMLKPKKRKAQ